MIRSRLLVLVVALLTVLAACSGGDSGGGGGSASGGGGGGADVKCPVDTMQFGSRCQVLPGEQETHERHGRDRQGYRLGGQNRRP